MLAQTVAGLRHFGVIDSLRSTLQHNYLIEFFPLAPSSLFLLQPVACFFFSVCFHLHTSRVIFSHDRAALISHLITRLFNYFKVKYAVSDEHWSVNGESSTALTAVS